MSEDSFERAASSEDGPKRTAALAAWVQSLASSEESKPVLVGGAAVELFTGGAYRTGDLDFVGALGEDGARLLLAHGFERRGRHWIHEERQIFLEFPSDALDADERAATIEVGEYTVLIIGLEELIVDRLAAWRFWRSEVDGVNAFLLWRASGGDLDWARLRGLAAKREIDRALAAFEVLVERAAEEEIAPEELEAWSRGEWGGSP